MSCPVCDESEFTVISGGWHDREVARCDGCGVVFDHLFVDGRTEDPTTTKVNCPECGSRTSADRDSCSYCDAPLDQTPG